MSSFTHPSGVANRKSPPTDNDTNKWSTAANQCLLANRFTFTSTPDSGFSFFKKAVAHAVHDAAAFALLASPPGCNNFEAGMSLELCLSPQKSREGICPKLIYGRGKFEKPMEKF